MPPTMTGAITTTLYSGEIIDGQSALAMDNLGNYARIAG
jgi:hypothetical protein